MKAVVAAFNQEKALVGAFSVITNLWMELFQALLHRQQQGNCWCVAAAAGGWAQAQAGTRVTMMREAAAVCWKAAVVEPVLVQTSLGTFQSRTWAPDTASYHAGLLTKQSPPHYYIIM